MRMRITAECDGDRCWEDYEYEADVAIEPGVYNPIHKMRREMEEHGWRIGRKTLCPLCTERLNVPRCKTCKYWRNKLMETPTCVLDDRLALAGDFCAKHVTDPQMGGDGQ